MLHLLSKMKTIILLLLTIFILMTNALATYINFVKTLNNTTFMYNSKELFFSGANLAWINYGNDFGNNQYNTTTKDKLTSYVDNISNNGGNSIRIWLFVEGASIPQFNHQTGMVISTDGKNTLVNDVKAFVQYAASKNVFVILCLWNGALMREQLTKELFYDDNKLQSFIDNALTPLVNGLKNEPGLAAYEIINEPEGSIDVTTVDKNEPCFDTKTVLQFTGAGWAKSNIQMKNMQRFINLQTSAIKTIDPNTLVTVGAWSEHSSTNEILKNDGNKFFNYWSDECLIKSGQKQNGILDFNQIHTYANSITGKFSPGSPFSVNIASVYKTGKPIIIGEFSQEKCLINKCTIVELYNTGIEKNFAGIFDWSLIGGDGNDDENVAIVGMKSLAKRKEVIVQINDNNDDDDHRGTDDYDIIGQQR